MTQNRLAHEFQRIEQDLLQLAFACRATEEGKGALQTLAELLDQCQELVAELDQQATTHWQDTQFLALPLRTQRMELGLLSAEE